MQYPKGFVVHRMKGVSGTAFKQQQQLIKLSQALNVSDIHLFEDQQKFET